jgi:transcription factor IIIB 90 kDa subunit
MQCMDRDWMTTGRRPSGLCGAAIIISARIHGYKRSTKQITDIVHVCDETIRRRLEEFSTTSTARMQKSDFDCADKIVDDGQGKDPPAYIKNRKREKESQEQIVNREILFKQAKEIEKIFSDDKKEKLIKIESEQGTTLDQTLVVNSHLKETNFESIKQNYLSKISDPIKAESSPLKKSLQIENEDLSDIEDVSNFIVTQEEYKLKKLLWEILFKDWIEEQKEKKKAEKKQVKKRIRKLSKLDTTISRDPVEAIKNSTKFGKKINLNLLNNMFKNK